MLRPRLHLSFVLLVTAAACTSFGTSGGSTSPVGASDAGPLPLDATGSADGAAPGFCARQTGEPRLCDDFDQGEVGQRWTRTPAPSPGASLTFDESGFASKPRSLRVRIAKPCAEGYAQLAAEVPSKPATVKISFSVEVLDHPTPAVLFAVVRYRLSNGGYYSVSLGRSGDKTWLDETNSGALTKSLSTIPYPASGWHRLEAELRFTTAPAHATARVDGTDVIDVDIEAPEPGDPLTTLDFGGYVGGACDRPLDVRLDDLVYELTPR